MAATKRGSSLIFDAVCISFFCPRLTLDQALEALRAERAPRNRAPKRKERKSRK